jgi:hypothetical protein
MTGPARDWWKSNRVAVAGTPETAPVQPPSEDRDDYRSVVTELAPYT